MAESHPVAIVTGAASGLGFQLAKFLVERKYKVFMADISSKGSSAASDLAPDGIDPSLAPTFVHTDVGSFDAQAALFATAYAHSGRIDVVIANAGIGQVDPLDMINPDVDPVAPDVKIVDVNFLAVLYGTQLFVHYARKERKANPGAQAVQKKMIVSASGASLYSLTYAPLYAATKHAVLGWVRGSGRRLAAENLALNCVLPAMMDTSIVLEGSLKLAKARNQVTPLENVVKAFATFLDANDRFGQGLEVSLDQSEVREQTPFLNDNQRWLCEDPDGIWGGKALVEYLLSKGIDPMRYFAEQMQERAAKNAGL